MSAPPPLSVITTTCNGERFLPAAIESILGQTFTDFEYILVDDGSTDGTPDVLADYASRDARILLIHNHQPLGPGGALNCALQAARGRYVANLDHDDLARPARLERQAAYLDWHPAVGVLGAWAEVISTQDKVVKTWKYPTRPALARWGMYFSATVLHSAVMARRELLLQAGGYSSYHRFAVDYQLWLRLLWQTHFANLPRCLAAYRISPEQVSIRHADLQHGQVILTQQAALGRLLGRKPDLQVVLDLTLARSGRRLRNAAAVRRAACLLQRAARAYHRAANLSPGDQQRLAIDLAHRLSRLRVLHDV
jgi:cellulose synthase/poly-beta-1,6-N-acetylglucosamine synthase-like glycosyltransferase